MTQKCAPWAREARDHIKKIWPVAYEDRAPSAIAKVFVKCRTIATASETLAKHRCDALAEMLPEGKGLDRKRCARWMDCNHPANPLPSGLGGTEEQRDLFVRWTTTHPKDSPKDIADAFTKAMDPYHPRHKKLHKKASSSEEDEEEEEEDDATPRACKLAIALCAWYVALTQMDGCVPCFTHFAPTLPPSRKRGKALASVYKNPKESASASASPSPSPSSPAGHSTLKRKRTESGQEDGGDGDGEVLARHPHGRAKRPRNEVDQDLLRKLEPGHTIEEDLVRVPRKPASVYIPNFDKKTSYFCEPRAMDANLRTRAPCKMASLLDNVDSVTLNGKLFGLELLGQRVAIDTVANSMEIKRFGDLPRHNNLEHATEKKLRPHPISFSELTLDEKLKEQMDMFDDVVGKARDRPPQVPFRYAHITRPAPLVNLTSENLAEVQLTWEDLSPETSIGFLWEKLTPNLDEAHVLGKKEDGMPKRVVRYMLQQCLTCSKAIVKGWDEAVCRKLLVLCARLRAISAMHNCVYTANVLRNMDHLGYGVDTGRPELGKMHELVLEGSGTLGQSSGIGPLAARIANACNILQGLDVKDPDTMDVTEETKRESRERYGDAHLLSEDSKTRAIQVLLDTYVAADLWFGKWPSNYGAFPWAILRILEEVGVEQYVSWTQMCALFLEPECGTKVARKFTESDRKTWHFTERVWGHISEEDRVLIRSKFIAAVIKDAAVQEARPAAVRSAEAAAYPLEHPMEGAWKRANQSRNAAGRPPPPPSGGGGGGNGTRAAKGSARSESQTELSPPPADEMEMHAPLPFSLASPLPSSPQAMDTGTGASTGMSWDGMQYGQPEPFEWPAPSPNQRSRAEKRPPAKKRPPRAPGSTAAAKRKRKEEESNRLASLPPLPFPFHPPKIEPVQPAFPYGMQSPFVFSADQPVPGLLLGAQY